LFHPGEPGRAVIGSLGDTQVEPDENSLAVLSSDANMILVSRTGYIVSKRSFRPGAAETMRECRGLAIRTADTIYDRHVGGAPIAAAQA